MNEIFTTAGKIIDWVRPIYKTWTGFFVSFLLLIPILALFKAFSIPLTHWEAPTSVLIVGVIHFAVWSVKSGKIIIPTDKILIVFSIEATGKAYTHFQDIFTQLSNVLRDLDLLPLFALRRIGHTAFRREIKFAHQYREDHKIGILIWGNAQNLKEKGKEVAPFKLYFTYEIKITDADQRDLLAADSALFMSDREWLVYDEDSRTYTATVTTDFVEVSLILLSISFLMQGQYDRAILILKQVQILLGEKQDRSTIGLAKQGRVNGLLFQALWAKLLDIRFVDIDGSYVLVERLLKLSPRNAVVWIEKARLEYLRGNIRAAKSCNKRARSFDRGNPLLLFNHGFFAILEKKYKVAVYHYNIITSRDVSNVNIASVVDFLENHYELDKDEHAYLFALGTINLFHFDKERGREQLQKFIQLATNSGYDVMVEKASEYLEEYGEEEDEQEENPDHH